ncbi:hypothetical protein IAU60_000792 [Kwoniella sp. DSM 27419]
MVTRAEDRLPANQAQDSTIMASGHRQEIHVATVNVRMKGHPYRSPSPSRPYEERPWSERKTRLVDALLGTGNLDIVGFQEVLHEQLLDLEELLGPTYGHVGVGRDDGKQAGEYSPIFYDKTKYRVVKWATIWLSPTPDVPGSRGWDAALPRIATLLTLRTVDDKLVHAVNTHYDHIGVRAKAESSLLIRSQIWEWVRSVQKEEKTSCRAPILLFGDFNSPPEEAGYRNITSLHPLPSGQKSYSFLDSFHHLTTRPPDPSSTPHSTDRPSPKQSGPYGPILTYTDFAPPGSRNATRIDFIMLGTLPTSEHSHECADNGQEEWHVMRYACLDNFVEHDALGWTGRWSDHRAVRVTISLLL